MLESKEKEKSVNNMKNWLKREKRRDELMDKMFDPKSLWTTTLSQDDRDILLYYINKGIMDVSFSNLLSRDVIKLLISSDEELWDKLGFKMTDYGYLEKK